MPNLGVFRFARMRVSGGGKRQETPGFFYLVLFDLPKVCSLEFRVCSPGIRASARWEYCGQLMGQYGGVQGFRSL